MRHIPLRISIPLKDSRPLLNANKPAEPPNAMISAGSQQQLVASMKAMMPPRIDLFLVNVI